MTIEQAILKIQDMLFEDNKEILKRITAMLDNGTIDLENYNDDYRLPKIVLHAIYRDMQYWRLPTREEDLQAVKNLENF